MYVAYVSDACLLPSMPHNGFHNSGPAVWRPPRPPPLWSMERQEIRKKASANAYKIYPCMRILPILRYSLYVAPGAIHLAESPAPYLFYGAELLSVLQGFGVSILSVPEGSLRGEGHHKHYEILSWNKLLYY